VGDFPRLGVSVLSFLQCSDTVGWVTKGTSDPQKPVQPIPKGSLPEQENILDNTDRGYVTSTTIRFTLVQNTFAFLVLDIMMDTQM